MQTDQSSGLATRITELIRWIAVRGIAAVSLGILVFGIGGRLVMLASRLLHPDTIGRITDNGNRIGEFTVGGTIGLIVFGGLFGGLAAGVVWVFIKNWIVDNPVVVGLGAVALGGLNLIEADNRDFVILGDVTVDLLLLLSLPFLFGLLLVPFDGYLDKKLPPARSVVSIVVYALLVSVAAPIIIPLFASFFDTGFCFCEHPPIWIGIGLIAATASTIYWWYLSLRGAEDPPGWLTKTGQISVLVAVVAGAVYLTNEILAIV